MNDSLAYLPLLVATGAAFVTIVILAATRERYHPVVLTLHILCLILVSLTSVYTIVNPMILPISIVLACSSIMMLAAAVANRITKPRIHEEKKILEQQEEIQDTAELDTDFTTAVKLLETGKDFTIVASEALTQNADIMSLLDKVNECLIRETQAHGGAILLVDGFEDVTNLNCVGSEKGEPSENANFS